MSLLEEYLQPLDESQLQLIPGTIGEKVSLYLNEPSEEGSIVIIGCPDLRGAGINNKFSHINAVRNQLYKLQWAEDWNTKLYDLGDIPPGELYSDTTYALEAVLKELLVLKLYPVVLGGSVDLSYSLYKALTILDLPLNFVSVDSHIEFGQGQELNEKNYLSKMITDEPNLLFHYSNIGYQSYYVSYKTLDILETMDFENYRLGIFTDNIQEAEPVLRSADFVALNLNSIESKESGFSVIENPNGFNNKEICAIGRYIGLTLQIKIAGIFNFLGNTHNKIHTKLVSQLLWYLIEGKNQQKFYESNPKEYVKYIVVHEDREMIFLKDKNIEKWWVGVNFDEEDNPQYLIPCSKKDYLNAIDGKLPERYWKTFKRFL